MRNLALLGHLKQLHTDTGKHELKKCGDNHDVPNRPDGHKHTLNHVLHWQRERKKRKMFCSFVHFTVKPVRDYGPDLLNRAY